MLIRPKYEIDKRIIFKNDKKKGKKRKKTEKTKHYRLLL